MLIRDSLKLGQRLYSLGMGRGSDVGDHSVIFAGPGTRKLTLMNECYGRTDGPTVRPTNQKVAHRVTWHATKNRAFAARSEKVNNID